MGLLNFLSKAGSEVSDFSNAVIDRTGGAALRGGVRTLAFLADPIFAGDQKKAASNFINKYAENNGEAAKKTGVGHYNEQSFGGRAGRITGTAINAAAEAYGIDKAAKAGTVLTGGGKGLQFLGGLAGGTLAGTEQQIAQGNPAGGVVQAIPRGAAQLLETATGQKSYTPGSTGEKLLFGNQPVESLQQSYQSQRAAGKSGFEAGVNTAISGVTDVLPLVEVARLAGAGGAKSAIQEQASKVSGLKPENVVNANEAGTLRDWADYQKAGVKLKGSEINELAMQARHAAKSAGIDITSGSADDVSSRIEAYMSQLHDHANAVKSIKEGGYINIPGNADELAKSTDVNEIKKQLDGNIPQESVEPVANAVAQTKDPNIVKNLVTGTSSVSAPVELPQPSLGFLQAAEEPKTPASEPSPANTAAQQVIDSLNGKGGAAAVREKQQLSYSQERGQRLASSQSAGADIPGQAGYQAEKSALSGELGKQQYEGLSKKLNPEEQDSLFTELRQQVKNNPNVEGYADINTQTALHKVIYGDSGVPTRSEIELLRNAFGATFADAAQSSIKSSLGDKAFALWRTGLLTGPQTITKIVTSHLVQGGAEVAKDVPAAAVDKFLSLFTGQRSTTATLRGRLEGFKLGIGDAKTYIKTGAEKLDAGNSLELRNSTTFNNKILQAYTDYVGRAHGSLYKPFSGSAHFGSLYDQAIAAVKTAKLSGADAEDAIISFVKDPPAYAEKAAQHDAEVATFQQSTQLGKVASAIQQKGGILGKVIVPFTKIPSAIATDLVSYSPVGGIKTLYDGIKAATSQEGLTLEAQRTLSQGLGRSIVGTAAIIPGLMLFNKGIMTLGYPTDPTEQKLWEQEGKQPNSVLIDGQWRSLGSLGPLGSVFSIGGHIGDSLAQGNDLSQAVTDGFVGGAQSIEEQSYLRGVSGAVNAVNDPGRYAQSFIKQTVGSVVPTGVKTIAGATDANQRQINSPLDAVRAAIPGARQNLSVKIDAFGNPLKAPETGLEKLIDPFQSSTASPSAPLTNELRRLQNTGYGIIPSAVTKTTDFNGIKTPLAPTQVKQLTTNIGKATETYWNKIVTSPGYDRLSDSQKRQLLSGIYSRVVTQQKTKFAQQNQLGRYTPDYRAVLNKSKQKKQYTLQ